MGFFFWKTQNIFLEFIFINIISGIGLPQNFFNLAEILVLRLLTMEADQKECSELEQWFVIKSLESVNHVKFTKECVTCMEKYVLITECLQIGRTWVCHNKPESRRQSSKEKVLGAAVGKVFCVLEHEMTNHY